MQTTSNLWEVLCRDFESERQVSRAQDCCEISKKFLSAARLVLRPDSVRMADALEIVGDVFQAAGEDAEASRYFEEARETAERLGAHSSQARLAAKLGLLFERLGRHDEAVARTQESVALYEDQRDFSQHALLLNHLGGIRRHLGDPAGAARDYTRALEAATRMHGHNHPETATALNNLGVARTECRQYDEAESLHMQALGIREKTFGPMHPEVAQSMANLGVVYHAMGKYDQARAYYHGASQIYRSFRAEDDPELQNLRENIAALPHDA